MRFTLSRFFTAVCLIVTAVGVEYLAFPRATAIHRTPVQVAPEKAQPQYNGTADFATPSALS